MALSIQGDRFRTPLAHKEVPRERSELEDPDTVKLPPHTPTTLLSVNGYTH